MEWIPLQSKTDSFFVFCFFFSLSHMLFLLFRIKKCSSRRPCASSSLFSLTPPTQAGPRPPPCPSSLSSWARPGQLPRAAVPRTPARATPSPRTAQGGHGWPPSRRTPAATLTRERRACRKISQPQEPARRLRNPPTRIWQIRASQPRTDGASRGRIVLTPKRQSAEEDFLLKTRKLMCLRELAAIFLATNHRQQLLRSQRFLCQILVFNISANCRCGYCLVSCNFVPSYRWYMISQKRDCSEIDMWLHVFLLVKQCCAFIQFGRWFLASWNLWKWI